MALSPIERRAKIQDVQDQFCEAGTVELVREYLRYEHAKNVGIKPQFDSTGLREMVDIHYDALRELLVERFDDDPDRVDDLMNKARPHHLQPLHYAND